MASLIQNLGLLASQNEFLAYFLLYLFAIAWGTAAVFTGVWLAVNKYLSWPTLIGVIVLADLSADYLWYSLGRRFRDTSVGLWIKNHLPRHDKIEAFVHRHNPYWIFLAKLIPGFSFPVLFFLGWTKINFKDFFKIIITALFIWVPVFFVLAHLLVLGLNYLAVTALWRKFEWLFLSGLAFFVAVTYLINKLLSGFLVKNNDSSTTSDTGNRPLTN